MSKKGLGKGLGALIKEQDDECKLQKKEIIEIDINEIQPNKNQPRKSFNNETIDELALSIKNFGIISPIIVKKKGDFYQIVSGERRFRAAKKIKLKTVPAIIKEYDELNLLQVSLVENIQRENLNAIEESMIYKILKDEFDLGHEEIAEKVGKNRATISNMLRLLNLDYRVQNFLMELRISQGHARAILAISDGDMQFELAEKIIEEGISVRQTEEIVRNILNRKNDEALKNDNKKNDEKNDEIFKNITNQLNQILSTKVKIKNKKDKGKIEIEYYSEDDLDRILCLFKKIDGGKK